MSQSNFCHKCRSEISSGSLFCNKCGEKLLTSSSVEPATNFAVLNRGIVCPICKNSDQVRKASSLIDSTTTTTSGGMIAAPIVGHGPVVVGGFAGTTTSDLSRRIIYFNKPTLNPSVVLKILGVFIGSFILSLVVGFTVLIAVSKVNPWLSFLLAPMAFLTTMLAPPLLMYKKQTTALIPSQTRWAFNLKIIREANYCSRDDISFDANFYGKPEEYALHVYKTH